MFTSTDNKLFISVSDPCEDRGEPNPNAGLILLTKDEDCKSGQLLFIIRDVC